MSMLEVAHENDIELEGKDSDAFHFQSVFIMVNARKYRRKSRVSLISQLCYVHLVWRKRGKDFGWGWDCGVMCAGVVACSPTSWLLKLNDLLCFTSGACEGSLACSTCHVIVMDMDYYNKLQDPTDEEMTCWILLLGLQRRKFWSHLGCQIVARPELDGICLALPAASRNFAVDGFVPKPC
ncbi:hypothetical protein WN943_002430 [Citrus x changshan-huyou]